MILVVSAFTVWLCPEYISASSDRAYFCSHVCEEKANTIDNQMKKEIDSDHSDKGSKGCIKSMTLESYSVRFQESRVNDREIY